MYGRAFADWGIFTVDAEAQRLLKTTIDFQKA